MKIPDIAFTAAIIVFAGLGIGFLARRRGQSFWAWFVFGTLIPVVALPCLFFTKSTQKPDEPPPAGMLPLATLSFLAIPALFGVRVLSAPATIPPYDGYFAQSDLKNVVANSPYGKAGLAIVTLTDIKEVSRSPTEAKCLAKARMSDTNIVSMYYRFFIEAEQVLIEAHWH